jgi:hypothetical protein
MLENREISIASVGHQRGRAVGEGLWPQARRVRYGEVRHRRSTEEGTEQSCSTFNCGGSGGKAGDRGEFCEDRLRPARRGRGKH